MSYTTIAKVREFSGFDDVTKISASVIRGKIAMADSKVDGAIGYRYALPLAYHRQNTITFSGTGTGAGTMSVIINGVTYQITISNGLTSSSAADLFRVAVKDSVHLQTEGYVSEESSEATVVIISKTDSGVLATADAEVNITNAGGTVNGITGTAGTRSDRYTPFITQLSTEIATALLYFDNYGLEAENTPQDGAARMDRLDEILLQLQGESEKYATLRLYDEIDKTELTLSDTGAPRYRATDTTSDEDYDGDDPTIPQVTITQKF
jgi:hypothetical protein